MIQLGEAREAADVEKLVKAAVREAKPAARVKMKKVQEENR